MRTFKLDTHSFKVAKAGSGPPMVFLHNGGSDHNIWHFQLPHFAATYTTYGVDFLGHGQSDRPDVPFDLDLCTRQLSQVIDKESLEQPVLVGNCIGAAAALEYVFHHPGKVRALILFNVCGGRIMLKETTGMAFDPSPAMKESYLALFKSTSKISWMHRRVLNTLFGPTPAPDHPVYLHLRNLQRGKAHPLSRWNLMRGLESFNKFSKPFRRPDNLPPTYLLWGEENKVLSVACGTKFSNQLKPDRYTRIKGTGHMAMSEKPDLVNLFLDEFLDEFC